MNRTARIATWLAFVAAVAFILRDAPGLDKVDTVPIPAGATTIEAPLLAVLIVGVAAAALPAFAFRPMRSTLAGLLVGAVTYRLFLGTRLAWWLGGVNFRLAIPDAQDAVIVLLGIAAYYAFFGADELTSYRRQAVERGVAPEAARQDANRLAVGYGLLATVGLAIAALLWGLFEGPVAEAGLFEGLRGGSWAVLILVLGAAGILALAFTFGRRRPPPTPTPEGWLPSWEAKA